MKKKEAEVLLAALLGAAAVGLVVYYKETVP